MSRLDLQFSDVYQRVSDFLGTGLSPTGDDLTTVKFIVDRAYRQFLYPTYVTDQGKTVRHTWSWMKTDYVLNTESDKYRYTLPIDFGRMLVKPTFSESSGYNALTKVSREWIDNIRALGQVTSHPSYYAIVPLISDVDMEQQWELWLWPIPSSAYSIKFIYLRNPDKPTADTDYFLGGPEASEIILEMAYAIAEQQEDDAVEHHTQLAAKLLKDMIVADSIDIPDTVGRVLIYPSTRYERGYVKTNDDEIYYADR